MYKLQDRVFDNASDALDHYIRNFQLNSDFKSMDTSSVKSINKEFRLDKLETLMKSHLKKPIFSNFIVENNINSPIEFNINKNVGPMDTGPSQNAINQVEKLISNLSCKVEDYSRTEGKLITD